MRSADKKCTFKLRVWRKGAGKQNLESVLNRVSLHPLTFNIHAVRYQ